MVLRTLSKGPVQGSPSVQFHGIDQDKVFFSFASEERKKELPDTNFGSWRFSAGGQCVTAFSQLTFVGGH